MNEINSYDDLEKVNCAKVDLIRLIINLLIITDLDYETERTDQFWIRRQYGNAASEQKAKEKA